MLERLIRVTKIYYASSSTPGSYLGELESILYTIFYEGVESGICYEVSYLLRKLFDLWKTSRNLICLSNLVKERAELHAYIFDRYIKFNYKQFHQNILNYVTKTNQTNTNLF